MIAKGGSSVSVRYLPSLTTPVAAHGDFVYLLKPPGILRRIATLSAWNIRTDTLMDICQLPTQGKKISDTIDFISLGTENADLWADATVNPSGDKMLVRLQSPTRSEQAAWLVDMSAGHRMLLSATSRAATNEAVWIPGYAVLAGPAGVFRVDTETGNVEAVYPKVDWRYKE